jgi:hypothetical protein
MSAEQHAKILGFLTAELFHPGNRRCTRVDLLWAPRAGQGRDVFRDEVLSQWTPENAAWLFSNPSAPEIEQLISWLIEVAEKHADALSLTSENRRYVVRTYQLLGNRQSLFFKLAARSSQSSEPRTAVEELVARVIEAVHTEAGKAEAAGEIAQLDAWQIALVAARELRDRVVAAQAAAPKPADKALLAGGKS